MVKDKNPIYSWSLFCPKVSRVRLSTLPAIPVPQPRGSFPRLLSAVQTTDQSRAIYSKAFHCFRGRNKQGYKERVVSSTCVGKALRIPAAVCANLEVVT